MAHIMHRYLLKMLMAYFCAFAIILTGLIWLTQIFRVVELVVSRGLDVYAFIKLSAYILPSIAYIVIPIAMFLAVLYFIYTLQFYNELITCSVLGTSKIRILIPIVICSLFVTSINMYNGLYFSPYSYKTFHNMRYNFKHNYVSILLQPGVFNTQSKGLVIYVGIEHNGTIEKIFIDDSRVPGQYTTILAETGSISYEHNNIVLTLHNGTHRSYNTKSGTVSKIKFATYSFKVNIPNNTMPALENDINSKNFPELLDIIHNNSNQAFVNACITSLNQRFYWPVASLCLSVLAYAMIINSAIISRRFFNVMNYIYAIITCFILCFLFLAYYSFVPYSKYNIYAPYLMQCLIMIKSYQYVKKS